MKHTERELKIKLSYRSWRKLSRLSNTVSKKQTNYYFLAGTDFCRIRNKGEEWELTLKQKANNQTNGCLSAEAIDGFVSVSIEHNQALTMLQAAKYISNGIPQEDISKMCGIKFARDFVYQGKLITFRNSFYLCGLLVELDLNVYNKKIDFELECETSNVKTLAPLVDFLSVQGMPLKKSLGKYYRFVSTKEGRKIKNTANLLYPYIYKINKRL